jgi:hypothetical protein
VCVCVCVCVCGGVRERDREGDDCHIMCMLVVMIHYIAVFSYSFL